ncbi:hypothetical protein JCM6882_007242 [Rhodosporidiobolus microsporus]
MSKPSAIPPQRTRNICIVAHVDHGKSSFADSLLAANNIISARLAGTIRYLDSREDEQERGITMESSAVSLRWRIPTPVEGAEPVLEDYKINLIDTPGHVDFSSEVSTASRLCDGAFVLVDAVEGVCTQTITVLRTIYLSHLRPILVINKLDRLITELKLAPSEAYHHLSRIIEDVNAVVGSFYSSERMEEDLRRHERKEKEGAGAEAEDAGGEKDDEQYEERDDSALYFDPAQGNVLFSSALDGWAFRISRFAQLYAAKLGMSEANLNKVLWGEWYLDPKTKRVLSRKKMEKEGKKLKPLFVQFVLENIWGVYDAVVLNNNPVKIDKIVASLSVRVRPQDLRSKDTRNLLLSIFSQWLPLAPSAFRAIVDRVPAPPDAQAFRVPRMLHPEIGYLEEAPPPKDKLEADLYAGKAAGANGEGQGEAPFEVAYVSKMFAVRRDELPENQRRQLTAEDMRERARKAREERERRKAAGEEGGGSGSATPLSERVEGEAPAKEEQEEEAEEDGQQDVLIGFARLYSGTLSVGQTLYAVLPRYNALLPPSHPSNAKHLAPITVSSLYMMMGRELLAVDKVEAGNLFAIGGLEGTVLRNATLCGMGGEKAVKEGKERDEDRGCLINLAGVSNTSAPIVRVALEPQDPSEMPKLVEGLRLLNQADPCVETLVQATGEHVILTAGELHLERCLKDLRDRFARIEITVSPPIVPFRETAVAGVDMAPPKTPNHPRGTVLGSIQSGLVTFTLRAVPLPSSVTAFLLANQATIRRLHRDRRAVGKADDEAAAAADDAAAAASSAAEAAAGDDEKDDEKAEVVKPEEFWEKLDEVLKKAGREWSGVSGESVWAFGPRRVGPNILFDRTAGAPRSLRRRLERQAALPSALATPGGGLLSPPAEPTTPSQAAAAEEFSPSEFPAPPAEAATGDSSLSAPLDMSTLRASLTEVDTSEEAAHRLPDLRELDENFDTAFQLAVNRGPLCAEPVVGMAYMFERVELEPGEMDIAAVRSKWSNARGQLISAGQGAFHSGLLDWSPRLQLAMYSCDIQATGEVLGKVYAVVAKRKGRIVSEEMKEGTAFFTVSALLPVVESFGFADEIRTRTSGAASPQLVFHGYETLDQDPFWVPTTEEELEDLGEKADRENIAKKYMEAVRRRKGMAVERKVVQHAEKQKTMKSA